MAGLKAASVLADGPEGACAATGAGAATLVAAVSAALSLSSRARIRASYDSFICLICSRISASSASVAAAAIAGGNSVDAKSATAQSYLDTLGNLPQFVYEIAAISRTRRDRNELQD